MPIDHMPQGSNSYLYARVQFLEKENRQLKYLLSMAVPILKAHSYSKEASMIELFMSEPKPVEKFNEIF